MPYHLLTGQLIYTNTEETGDRIVASDLVSNEIQTAFISRLVQQHQNAYRHLYPGHQAVYINQITPEQNLFGWLFDSKIDGVNSRNPYFVCYYLAEPLLFPFQLETIFNCLHKGPVELINRHSLPNTLRSLIVKNFWSYKSACPGVIVPPSVRARSHLDLKQGELLDLFYLAEKQEIPDELNATTREQQIANFAIYTRHLVKAVDAGKVSLDRAPSAIQDEAIAPYLGYQEKLQQYKHTLLRAIGQERSISDRSRKQLKLLQQNLQLKKEDIELIEDLAQQEMPSSSSSHAPIPARSSERRFERDRQTSANTLKLFFNAGIAATILLGIVSCYSVLKTSIAPPKEANNIQILSEQ